MKKLNLFLSAALIMAASVMFAQGLSPQAPLPGNVTLTPAPAAADCGDCTIDQIVRVIPFGSQNVNDIYQRGHENDANVLQEGLGNKSYITQDGDDANGMGGFFNTAKVYQEGVHNYSLINQDGDRNNGIVIQTGDLNYAKQSNIGVGWAEENDAYINQDGTGNAAVQTQYYDNNEARIDQDGTNNETTQYQSSGPLNQAAGSYASSIQFGTDNMVSQRQIGSFNNARTEQSGIGNKSNEVQTAGSYLGSGFLTNLSRVFQDGDNNTNCLTQAEGFTGANYNYVYQLGDLNFAKVNQNANNLGSSWNMSGITQLGDSNKACVDQNSGSF